MFEEVNRRVKDLVFATVPLLNILTIDVPDLFERAVIKKIMVAQEVHTLTMRKHTQKIRSNIGVVSADVARDIVIINAEAHVKGLLIEAETKALSSKKVLQNKVALY